MASATRSCESRRFRSAAQVPENAWVERFRALLARRPGEEDLP